MAKVSRRQAVAGVLLMAAAVIAACDRPDDLRAVATEGPPRAQPTRTEKSAASPRSAPAVPWRPLVADNLHDPANPALKLLQEPAEALSVLAPSQEGNFVDWVAALRSGQIAPRTNIYPGTKIRVLDLDVLLTDTAAMPVVRFPHRPHTEWLDCSNCHDKIFVAKRGANPINMYRILQGEFCGQCHGAVSFPLTECRRCHSVPRDQALQATPQ